MKNNTKEASAQTSTDETEKELALYKFKYEMALAEKSIEDEGTVNSQIWLRDFYNEEVYICRRF